MLDTIILAIRIVQFVFAVIVVGTGGYVLSVWSNLEFGFYVYTPSQLGFIIFCAVWTFIVVLYQVLVPRFAEKLSHKFIILAIDALTMLFWFAGFIALSVFTGYADPAITVNWYKTLQACCAFSAFTWVLFVITTVLNALSVFRGNTSHKHGEAVHANV